MQYEAKNLVLMSDVNADKTLVDWLWSSDIYRQKLEQHKNINLKIAKKMKSNTYNNYKFYFKT